MSFKFVFIAQLMYEIFGISDHLCMALLENIQDIVKMMGTILLQQSILLQSLSADE